MTADAGLAGGGPQDDAGPRILDGTSPAWPLTPYPLVADLRAEAKCSTSLLGATRHRRGACRSQRCNRRMARVDPVNVACCSISIRTCSS